MSQPAKRKANSINKETSLPPCCDSMQANLWLKDLRKCVYAAVSFVATSLHQGQPAFFANSFRSLQFPLLVDGCLHQLHVLYDKYEDFIFFHGFSVVPLLRISKLTVEHWNLVYKIEDLRNIK